MGRPISSVHSLYETLAVGNDAGTKDVFLSDVITPPLKFGGATSSYPGLRRTGARLEARLADNSAFADFLCAQFFVGATDARFRRTAGPTVELDNGAGGATSLRVYGTLIGANGTANISSSFGVGISDSSQIAFFTGSTDTGSPDFVLSRTAAGKVAFLPSFSAFSMLQFGGTTSLFPALKKSGTGTLAARLADDSDDASLTCAFLQASFDVIAGATRYFYFSGRSRISSPLDGKLLLSNNGLTDFTLLQFGGTTSSFPALRRTAAGLDARLADDTAYASFTALNLGMDSSGILFWTSRCRVTSPADGNILLTKTAGSDFGLLKLGGETAFFPALKRNGAALEARLADDTGLTNLITNKVGTATLTDFVLATNGSSRWTIDGSGGHLIASVDNTVDIGVSGGFRPRNFYLAGTASIAGSLEFTSASVIRSLANGNLTIYNNAQTDFSLLQFGGTTSSFPAIKRNSAALDVRLADDSAYAPLSFSNGFAYSGTSQKIALKPSSSYLAVANGMLLQFYSGTDLAGVGSFDVAIFRNGAGILAHTNGTSACGYQVYNTTDFAGNYEFAEQQWVGNLFYLRTTQGGTGSARHMILGPSGAADLLFQTSGTLRWYVNGADLKPYTDAANNLGGQANRVVNAYVSNLLSLGNPAGSSNVYLSQGSVDGSLKLTNAATTGFAYLQFGGTTSSYPALRRNAAKLDVILADASAYADLSASIVTANSWFVAATGTVTADSPLFSGTQTWNNVATIFSAFRIDVTDTTSAAASKLMELRVGGANKAYVKKDGSAFFAGALEVDGSGSTHGETCVVDSSSEEITLSTGGTTTDSAANLLPADAVILSVVARVTTTITVATAWKVGDATTADRFVTNQTVLTAGTTAVGLNQNTVAGNQNQAAAAKVRITTTGTPGAGKIRVTVYYMKFTAPTS